jgi:hypothetical protein
MKTLLTSLFVFTTLISFSQKKEVKSFMSNDTKIEYSRIDYSKYGIAQFFITMYNESSENDLIEKKSISCLRSKERLYHTLYFFLEIPTSLTDEKQKTELFTQFVEHLKKDENMDSFNLYLNFDINYSIPYQLSKDNVKRVTTNITSNKICKTLTIR